MFYPLPVTSGDDLYLVDVLPIPVFNSMIEDITHEVDDVQGKVDTTMGRMMKVLRISSGELRCEDGI